MKVVKFNKLSEYDIIEHGFSTKIGGVSKGIYESMNLGFNRGDSDENVRENFKIISKFLNMPYENMVLSAQTHTTNIKIVTEKDKGKGIIYPRDYENIDGLITNESQIPLVTFYADCVPLVLFDPVKKVIAASHSGWRGTVMKMGKVTVDKMVEVYGCNPKDIIACIGPSICKKCYEVSADVGEAFMEEFKDWGYENIVFPKNDEKYHIDLWEANKTIFKMSGIEENNIEVSEICTCCNNEWLFSHRATDGKRGNLAAFIMLK